MIVMTRVDHRLLHGQVVFAWSKFTGTDCILIANDSLASNKLRMNALRLAKPEGVKLVMKSVDDSIAAITSGATDKYKLFIIIESIADAARLCQGLVGTDWAIKELNLGGVAVAENKRQISKAVSVSDEECELIRGLEAAGTHCYVQMVPSEQAQDALALI